jgi:amino acid adenylation domain-containing protein
MQTLQTSGFRISDQQRRIWPGVGESTLNAQCVLRIVGELDTGRLREALQAVVDRHEILRTTFPVPTGLRWPVQAVAEHGRILWREAAEVEACRAKDWSAPFDFAEGPLVRASFVAVSASENILILTLPSLCADAASLRNIVRELRDGYAGEAPETEDAIQYIPLSEWQQAQQDGDDAEQGRAYWRSRKTSPALVLPLQHAPHGDSAFVVASCDVALPLGTAGIERADAWLLGCWIALLGRVSGQSALRVGYTCAGRSYEEFEAAVGPVARVVPVGAELRDGMRFRDLADELEGSIDEAGDWHEFYERQEHEGPSEAVGFELTEWLQDEPSEGPQFELEFQQACAERFQIRLSVTRAGDDIGARIQYDPQVFSSEYVTRLAAQFSTLTAAALEDPFAPFDRLPILSEAERRFVVEDSNRTRVEYRREVCVHTLFAEQVSRTPDGVAVVFDGGALSYGELDRRANRLAHRLRALGVAPEVRVGICMRRSPEMIVGLLAVLKAGGAYVPLEPGYPAERLEFMLADAQVAVLLTERSLIQRLPCPGAQVLCLDDPFDSVVGAQPDSEPESGVRAENLVYALYTSGSTGKPKGAMITHRSLVNYLTWCCEAYAVGSGAGTVVHSPIAFDATITALFPALLVGRRVELLREAEGIEGLPEAMRRSEGFSLIKITPAHLSLLGEAVTDSRTAAQANALVIGGDALSGARLEAWRRLAPKTRLINEYGPTETVVGCCIHEVCERDMADEIMPIGRPIANTTLFVLDSLLEPLPTGVPGELFIGGDGVCRGYLGRPALTAERFLPDAFSGVPGARFYRTGDLTVRYPDGVLSFLGRMDHQVKIRSYRVGRD